MQMPLVLEDTQLLDPEHVRAVVGPRTRAVMVNTPAMLRIKAKRVRELGVRPELEVFDTGHLVFVKEMLRDGLLDDPVMIQLCMGIPYGAPDDPGTLLSMVNQLPAGAIWSAFSIGRMELPYVAMATLAASTCV